MGGSQASNVLMDIKIGQLKKEGKEINEEDKKKFLDEIKSRYDKQTDVLYAASRLWVDEVIDPAKTREIISYSIELSNNNPEMKQFNPGVIQT
jgi:acetyl-CoA carboxylase carboxyltransferase component